VVERRLIGRSVRGRPIYAWRVGRPANDDKAVIISTMHGDERQTRQILQSLMEGREIRGIDMWLVPTYNPDGYARGTRKNARGVDLNRNYPYRWADLDGRYESGRRARSEPETRAVMRFLSDIRPTWVVSFHQPLHGVDTDTKRPGFARRLASELNLPRKAFTCGGVCHGTMTMWFNHNFAGTAITVEYGARPPRERMRVHAPRQLLRALYARRTAPS
jgi:murein tripeptide amidase MpaA